MSDADAQFGSMPHFVLLACGFDTRHSCNYAADYRDKLNFIFAFRFFFKESAFLRCVKIIFIRICA